MENVHGEAAYETLARAKELERQGRSIIHLEIGEPDFDTPEPIVDSAVHWLKRGETHYCPSAGILELRQAIARNLSETHRVDIDPAQTVITPGAKMTIFATIMALVDPGDEVIYPNPAYPAYEADIRLAGATPVPVRLEESQGFRFDLEEVERKITPRTKMIVVNSPANPTGGVLTADDLKRIAELAQKHDLLILSDEIYSEIYYDERPASMLGVRNILDRLILISGFSKTFAMTGWRLGFGIIPRDLVPAVVLLINNSVSCTATFTQRAAIEAFTELTSKATMRMVQEFRERRDVFVDGLNAIKGIRCLKPQGAFYAFPNVSELGKPSKELADRLLNEAGVAVLPGTAFGDCGEGYLRFSFANSLPNLKSALERIRDFVGRM